jgi:uncharacterized iron-regulated protein
MRSKPAALLAGGPVRAAFLALPALLVLACTSPCSTPPSAVAEPRAGAALAPWEAPLRRDHPLAGRLFDVSAGAVADEAALFAEMLRSDFVLLGESHDNPDHHRLQARVIGALVARGQRPAVAFEMLSADVAPALAELRGRPAASAEALRRAVDWDASGWPDFALYQPVFEAALAADLPVVAADASAALLRAVARRGTAALAEVQAARLGVVAPIPEAFRRAHEEAIREAHCGYAPEARLGAMARVQWIRDAHLAAALLEAAGEPGTDGAVLIAGAGHVRRDRGVPWHLERLAPGASALALAMVEIPRQAAAATHAQELLASIFDTTPPFDWIWFTPATDDRDPCERFRERLEAMGAAERP